MRRTIVVLAVLVGALWAAAVMVWIDAWPLLTQSHPAASPTTRYAPPAVEVADGVDLDPTAVAAEVERIVSDSRGWRADLGHLTVRIVQPGTWGTQWMPGTIGVAYGDQSLAVVSAEAWTVLGPRLAARGGTLDDQRTWVVLHEIGHLLGHRHVDDCPAPGPAPIMRRTTYGIGECELNVWPHPAT